jgi:hypothetical protein
LKQISILLTRLWPDLGLSFSQFPSLWLFSGLQWVRSLLSYPTFSRRDLRTAKDTRLFPFSFKQENEACIHSSSLDAGDDHRHPASYSEIEVMIVVLNRAKPPPSLVITVSCAHFVYASCSNFLLSWKSYSTSN